MIQSIRTLIIVTAALGFISRAFAADPGNAPSATPSASPALVRQQSQQGLVSEKLFDDTYQFIFFATLEGLYRDGVSDADVDSLLARKDGGGYLNFIYTCPICMPVEGAIVTYKLRPRIDHMKVNNHQTQERTFGFGLPNEVSEALKSEKAGIRLKAVNELVSKWIAYRMDHSSLTDDQKANLVDSLKKKRDEGMKALRIFAMDSKKFATNPKGYSDDLKYFAPGYEDGDECALCNAALQMPLKLKKP